MLYAGEGGETMIEKLERAIAQVEELEKTFASMEVDNMLDIEQQRASLRNIEGNLLSALYRLQRKLMAVRLLDEER